MISAPPPSSGMPASPRIAFLMDERLPHDRKIEFHKLITRIRSRLPLEILPAGLAEEDLLARLQEREVSLLLLPWYRLLSWKKLEHHFGTLRLDGPTTVAGYFADALLPFELPPLPSCNHLLLLDFYRAPASEIETLLRSLLFPECKAGFRGLLPLSTPIHHQTWFPEDAARTRCIDQVMDLPLLGSARWSSRSHQLRFFLTALWSLAFQATGGGAELELAEANHRLLVKLTATLPWLSLKDSLRLLWPLDARTGPAASPALQDLARHCDFLRVAHFPESHQVEFCAFFWETSPALRHPGEVRGLWIEPLKLRLLQKSSEEGFLRRHPVAASVEGNLDQELQEVLERLKAVHLQAQSAGEKERFVLEHRCSNIRFLVEEIEKSLARKKKIA